MYVDQLSAACFALESPEASKYSSTVGWVQIKIHFQFLLYRAISTPVAFTNNKARQHAMIIVGDGENLKNPEYDIHSGLKQLQKAYEHLEV